MTMARFDSVVENDERNVRPIGSSFGSRVLFRRSNKDRDLVRPQSLGYTRGDPSGDASDLFVLRLLDRDFRWTAVEYRDGTAAIFCESIDVGKLRRQELVCLSPNLMRRSVVDP